MTPNPLILLAAALIPLLLSLVWYSDKLFGGETWKKLAHLSDEQASKPFAKWKYLILLIFNFFLAAGLFSICVHQSGVLSLVGGNPELLKTGVGAEFMAAYGQNHLSFGHGVLHGVIAAVCLFIPPLLYLTYFERKSGKYFWVNFGFWLISLALMGGVIGQWAAMPV